MSFVGEATGAAIGTIIFWAVFCGLTLGICGIVNLGARLRNRHRRRELDRYLHGWDWPPL
jgi:hypothetical protein